MKKIIQFGFSLALSLLIMLVGMSIAMIGQGVIVNPAIGPSLLGGLSILFGLSFLGFGLVLLIRAGTMFLDSMDVPAEPSTLNKHQRNRLKFITALSILLLLAACFVAFALPFGSDGCSSGTSNTFFIMAGWCFSYPFVIIGSMIAAWILQNKNHPRISLLTATFPFVFPLFFFLHSLSSQTPCL